jgi:hypothetical protein
MGGLPLGLVPHELLVNAGAASVTIRMYAGMLQYVSDNTWRALYRDGFTDAKKNKKGNDSSGGIRVPRPVAHLLSPGDGILMPSHALNETHAFGFRDWAVGMPEATLRIAFVPNMHGYIADDQRVLPAADVEIDADTNAVAPVALTTEQVAVQTQAELMAILLSQTREDDDDEAFSYSETEEEDEEEEGGPATGSDDGHAITQSAARRRKGDTFVDEATTEEGLMGPDILPRLRIEPVIMDNAPGVQPVVLLPFLFLPVCPRGADRKSKATLQTSRALYPRLGEEGSMLAASSKNARQLPAYKHDVEDPEMVLQRNVFDAMMYGGNEGPTSQPTARVNGTETSGGAADYNTDDE